MGTNQIVYMAFEDKRNSELTCNFQIFFELTNCSKIFSAVLKFLSIGTELPGIDKYILASFDIMGNRDSFFSQKFSEPFVISSLV